MFHAIVHKFSSDIFSVLRFLVVHSSRAFPLNDVLLIDSFVFIVSEAGARNFLFLNVPPIDRSPLVCMTYSL